MSITNVNINNSSLIINYKGTDPTSNYPCPPNQKSSTGSGCQYIQYGNIDDQPNNCGSLQFHMGQPFNDYDKMKEGNPSINSPGYNKIDLNNQNFVTLIFSTLIAGIHLGTLIKNNYPETSFNKDYLYGMLIGQLFQEDGPSWYKCDFKGENTDCIDTPETKENLLGIGQGGPFQINSWLYLDPTASKDVSICIFNYIALGNALNDKDSLPISGEKIDNACNWNNGRQNNICGAVNTTKGNSPVGTQLLDNQYFGPFIAGYWHYLSIRSKMVALSSNPGSTPTTAMDVYNMFGDVGSDKSYLDIYLNYNYNAGYWSEISAGFTDIVLNYKNNTQLKGCTEWSNSQWKTTRDRYDALTDYTIPVTKVNGIPEYSQIFCKPLTTTSLSFFRYPLQVRNTIDQLCNRNKYESYKGKQYAVKLSILIGKLQDIMVNIYSLLSYLDEQSKKIKYIPKNIIVQEFEKSYKSVDSSYTLKSKLSYYDDTERNNLYKIVETTIENLMNTLNTTFTEVIIKDVFDKDNLVKNLYKGDDGKTILICENNDCSGCSVSGKTTEKYEPFKYFPSEMSLSYKSWNNYNADDCQCTLKNYNCIGPNAPESSCFTSKYRCEEWRKKNCKGSSTNEYWTSNYSVPCRCKQVAFGTPYTTKASCEKFYCGGENERWEHDYNNPQLPCHCSRVNWNSKYTTKAMCEKSECKSEK